MVAMPASKHFFGCTYDKIFYVVLVLIEGVKIMKCPQCGKEAAEDEQFCKSCGAEVTEVVAVNTEPAVANPAPAQATTQTQNEANGQPSVNVYVNTQQQTPTADTSVGFEVSSNEVLP